MAIIRWDPNTEMQTMRTQFEHMIREMDRMFGGGMQSKTEFSPTVSVFQKENQIIIECELPGLEQRDVTVSSTPESITISGEIRKRERIQEQDILLNERTYGRFTRTIKLPETINFEKTHATFKNGLLTITAPLAESAHKKPRRIQIEG